MIILDDLSTIISVLTNPIILLGYLFLLAVLVLIRAINIVPKATVKTKKQHMAKVIMPKKEEKEEAVIADDFI